METTFFAEGDCHVYRRSPHPLPLLPGHQPRRGPAPSGLVGPAEGHRPGGHRGLHPSRLAGGAPGAAPPRRGGALQTAGRSAPAGRPRRSRSPVPHHRGDQLHLQTGREDPEGPQPDPPPLPGGGGRAVRQAGGHRQHPLRRAAHPGAGQPGSAGADPGHVSGRGVHPRPHLDAPLRPVRCLLRLRHHGGVLRRPDRSHPRGGDGPVLRPAHELAGLRPGRPHPGVPLRRPLPLQAGPGGRHPGHRPELPGAGGGHPHRSGVFRHHRVLPGGREVPPGRPPELRGVPDPGGDGGPWRRLPRVREKADHRRGAPGGGAGGPARRLSSKGGEALRVPGSPAGGPRRLHRRLPHRQGDHGPV